MNMEKGPKVPLIEKIKGAVREKKEEKEAKKELKKALPVAWEKLLTLKGIEDESKLTPDEKRSLVDEFEQQLVGTFPLGIKEPYRPIVDDFIESKLPKSSS